MASVRKRGNTWSFRAWYQDKTGEWKQIERGGFHTEREARNAGERFELKVKTNKNILLGERPFAYVMEEYIEAFKKKHVGLHEYYSYLRYNDIVFEYFKNKKMSQITSIDYQLFLDNHGEGRTKGSVQKIHNAVSGVFKYAHANGMIAVNPTYGARLNYTKDARPRSDRYLNQSELSALREYLMERTETYSSSIHLILLAIATGARFGELVGLSYEDFDYGERMIKINKTFDYHFTNEYKATKSKSSVRDIVIDDTSADILQQLVIQRKKEHLEKRNNPRRFIFVGRNELPITHRAVHKTIKKACNELGIKSVSLHALRHTHASVLLHNKVPIEYISKRLGHSSINITQEYYLHIIKEMEDKSEEILNNLFSNI